MTGYKILRTDKIPDSLKNKPKWQLCIIFSAGLLIMTLSAIGAGVFIGYTYCYVAHGTGFKTGDGVIKQQQLKDSKNIEVPIESKEDAYSKTINGALVSNIFVQKIIKFGHSLWDEDIRRSYDKMKLKHEI